MIPGHPGHLPRDSGTERADRWNVKLGLPEWTVPPVPIALGFAWMGCVLLARRLPYVALELRLGDG